MEHEISVLTGWLQTAAHNLTGSDVHLSDQGVIAWFIVILSTVTFVPMSRRLSVDTPGVAQQMLDSGFQPRRSFIAKSFGLAPAYLQRPDGLLLHEAWRIVTSTGVG